MVDSIFSGNLACGGPVGRVMSRILLKSGSMSEGRVSVLLSERIKSIRQPEDEVGVSPA